MIVSDLLQAPIITGINIVFYDEDYVAVGETYSFEAIYEDSANMIDHFDLGANCGNI